MEPVPFLRRDIADDGVFGPLGRDGFAEGDGDEEAGLGAFGVDFGVDAAGFIPGVSVLFDVLGGVRGCCEMWWSWVICTSSHHVRTASRSRWWLSL